MEKKGIQTERGNHNRKITAFNLEFKKFKAELSKLTSWISSLLVNLQSKYDEYKQEKKEEYENKAELFNLYEYISIYHELQGEKARKLNPYASNKKIGADLRRFSKARIYLKDNNLRTIADLQEKISTIQANNKKISQDIKVKTTRIESLNKCFVYADIIKDNKQIFEEWNSKSLFKDSFYNAAKTVNDDYGIDLSIEIDKAIKRGEKPSVIEQIKKYQEQQEKYEQRKEKTKDYYRNEER